LLLYKSVQQERGVCEICLEFLVLFATRGIKIIEQVTTNMQYHDNQLPKDGSTVRSQNMCIRIIHQTVDSVQCW